VRTQPASMSSRPWVLWPRKHAFAIHLAQCFLFVLFATVFVGLAPEENLIWVANGVLLAYLLLAPRRRWPAYLTAGFAAQLAGIWAVYPHWRMNVLLAVLNLAEVLIGSFMMRRRSAELPRFTERAYLIRFAGYAVVTAPLVAGLIYALISSIWLQTSPVPALIKWTVADGLGIGVATPACVAIFRTRFRGTLRGRPDWIYLALVCAVTLAVFSQTKAPLAFVIYPFLLLVLLRLGLGWAAMAIVFVAGAGSWHTIRGQGPFALANSVTPLESSVLLQVFLACGMFMLYSVSMILESEHATKHRLQKIAALHALVTENSRDAILIVDFKGYPTYVSPALQRITGWSAEETQALGLSAITHPEDRPKLVAALAQLPSGTEGAILEHRLLTRNGEYIWVEASLRAFADPRTGFASGVLGTVRDISERKRAEQQLRDAYQALEALAVTDALTGLANRRRFDQCLASEWRRGLRDRKPLSLLMIDADLFKSYNDTYGHLRGDSCLRQIAEAALDVVARPGDLVARFGGEEFAVILPNTGSEGAFGLANEICAALRSRKLPHSGNPHGIMTVSVGCATLAPSFGLHSVNLVELADEALYNAKRNGRNQVCNGNAVNVAGSESLDTGLAQAILGKTA
jgi:diguanylate cyclase (GGDEF)-like protein/PAS domain S-box-containing protein